MEQLRRRFPHAVVLAFDPQGAGARPAGTYSERLQGLDDTELLRRFVQDVRGREAGPEELALLGEALAAPRVASVA
jgi:exonuclease SbcD